MNLAGFRTELHAWLDEHHQELAPRFSPPGTLDERIAQMQRVKSVLFEAGWMRFGWPERVGGRGGSPMLRTELGAALAETVGERNAALMVHHGIVACGVDVATAVMTAVLLERGCRANMRTLGAGGPQTWSPDEEALAKRTHCYSERQLRAAWDYLARTL